MDVNTTLTESLESLPKTQYLTLLGVGIAVAAVGFEIGGMSTEAGLSLSLGVFFVVLGVISHVIIWGISLIENARM